MFVADKSTNRLNITHMTENAVSYFTCTHFLGVDALFKVFKKSGGKLINLFNVAKDGRYSVSREHFDLFSCPFNVSL